MGVSSSSSSASAAATPPGLSGNASWSTMSRSYNVVIFGKPNASEVALLMRRLNNTSFHVLAVGRNITELKGSLKGSSDINDTLKQADIAVVCGGTSPTDLNTCLAVMQKLRWLHSCSAGVEHLMSIPNLAQTAGNPLRPILTNARGVYRFSLAEYVLYACKYFALDQVRLDSQKAKGEWTSFETCELRGRTIGVVGFGDIGKATATLARAFGMNVLAHRRDTGEGEAGNLNGVADTNGVAARVYGGKKGLLRMLRQCEFVCLVTPLTEETVNMFSTEEFLALDRRTANEKGQRAFVPGVEPMQHHLVTPSSRETTAVSPHVPASPPPAPDDDALDGADGASGLAPVFINIGRGKCCDTSALVEALQVGILRGAALDVTAPEPLPSNHALWKFKNVLISPHNADKTTYFQKESVLKFVELTKVYSKAMRGGGASDDDRLRRFYESAGGNVVDKMSGY
ncbi:hypothetical protein PPROV_000269700 [Pycnococcus provasolii]|uniref:D-isomer specific 2-hydroxyacid dehydrogenase NAD-binding domain-containing protein n=1 Tax=Pycnococcus provasolii TaxID=41880 RepID=A0A830HBT0_9CHLO|nr:hypothetical protein PPROV_000269700 [Pycnococcus provasolii]